MGPPETDKFLRSKGHGQQDKMTAYRMVKYLHQPRISQRTDVQNIQRTQEIGI